MTDGSDDSKAIYLRLLRHVVPYWRPFALGTAMMIVLGLTEPAFPAILEMIVSSFEERALGSVPLYAALFLGVFLLRGLSSFLSVFLLESVAARLVLDLRKEMFDRLMRIPAPIYDNVASGTIISKVTYDAQQVTDAATRAVTVLVRDSVAVVGLLGWMLWIDWKLTLIALATAPVVMAIVVYFSRRLRRMAHGVQHTMGDVTHVLQESIEGHKVVKVFSGPVPGEVRRRRGGDGADRADDHGHRARDHPASVRQSVRGRRNRHQRLRELLHRHGAAVLSHQAADTRQRLDSERYRSRLKRLRHG